MSTTMDPVARESVSKEWLEAIFKAAGYEVEDVAQDGIFLAKHPVLPSRVVRYIPGIGIITMRTPFPMKAGGFGGKKDIEKAVEKANSESWLDTFYLDDDGDLWTSSYIFVTDHISGADVTRFLAAETTQIMVELEKSGLAKHRK